MFQSGDGRAFEDLYRRYFQRVFRYCLKRVGDPHEAEEIAQEAFVRAYSAMPRFSGERRFYPWLSVIASRLCVDHHRRRARTVPSDDVDPGVVDGGQEEILAQVDRALLRSALDKMVPRHREALRLREEEGWSYERIAAHFGVGVGTIEALLFRARRALRREFHALAGADSRLAGIPIIGYALRRLADLKGRFGEAAAQAAPMLAASAVSIAVIIGTVAAGTGNSTPQTVQSAAPRAAQQVPEIAMPALAASAPVVAPQQISVNLPENGAPDSTPPLIKPNSALGITTYEDGKQQAADDPVKLEVAGIFLSVADPVEGLLP